MQLLPRSTSGLVALVGTLIAIGALLTGALSRHTVHEALEEQLDHRIAAESAGLLHLPGGSDTQTLAAAVRQRMASASPGLDYLVFDAGGRQVAGTVNAAAPAPGSVEFLRLPAPQGGQRLSQALTTSLPDGGRLTVAADRQPVDEADRRILVLTIACFGGLFALGVGGAAMVGAVLRRRLDRIDATARAIIGGNLGSRVPRDHSGSEFDRLAATLNEMLERIGELLENLRQVSNDVAHDLRTPLTRLRHGLQKALADGQDTSEMRFALEEATRRTDEILEVFAALLRISEIESLSVRAAFQCTDLSALVEEVADAFRTDIENTGHVLRLVCEAGVHVHGDRRLLAQLLINLLENAARHTPAGSVIEVGLAVQDDCAVLSVADDGPGIPPEAREAVLRRFTRLERSRTSVGNGLGLSLVAAVCKAHDAVLNLGDNGPGLYVTARFPVAPHGTGPGAEAS
jgi:signal transduction histidine kinase